ncbi:MAG TPA: hypothetical protein VGR78_17715, partial [Verrucomicrobiae bacterium]|nr:hypothetical protein [Verrucomicrobiae bacterium]
MKLLHVTNLLVLTALLSARAAEKIDTNQISQITGLKGTFTKEEGVYKVSSPRTDVRISVDNWQLPP